MNTLKGVIAASTGKGVVAPDESDLHMVPWYFVLSSGLYAVEFKDETISSSPNVVVKKTKSPAPIEHAESTGILSAIDKIRMVLYSEYHNPPDDLESTGNLVAVDKIRMVLYSNYNNPPENTESTGTVTAIDKIRSAGYIGYSDTDSTESSATLTYLEKIKL